MKTTRKTLLSSVLCCAWLLSVPQEMNSQSPPALLRLEADCAGNKVTLHWEGALGVKLQQATNLTNPLWQDVPGSDGASSMEMPMTNIAAWFRLLDLGLDSDRDDLFDAWELEGWDIYIDAHGFGSDVLDTRRVTSDPGLGDTDGDGIEDYWEWLLGTDPRATDTDADGLSDAEEWFKWHTSPTSVDTDGDSRGPDHNLPPKAQLFDGNELSLLHTSPTLADTDGDGRTDYEEYDQLGRSPLVAQLPNLTVELVDAVDIRLDVEYAEEAGSAREYGGELSISDSTRNQYSASASLNWSLTVGLEAELAIGVVPKSANVSVETTFGAEVTAGFETETSRTVEQSHSDYTTDSRTRTETAASGSMSGGIRLVNTGPVTYTLTDLGTTVRYLMPGGGTNRAFKTLATLVPALGANGITLAPGDSTPVLQVQATGLNASRVKEFMARPNSLYLEPAFYELENAEGLNFDFLEEVTRWRTARVQIDFGDGRNEEYRIATNVERNEDGSYAGVKLGNVMSNILQVPFQTRPIQNLVPGYPSNQRVLYSVRALVTTSATNGFWTVFLSDVAALQTPTHFEDLVLRAGDEILLTFVRDEDGDGLFAPEEQHYGTTEATSPDAPPPSDSDGDGLTDVFEARTGWDVVVLGRTNHVYSDPREADQDGDGLNDSQESQQGTDPTRPDTDADGLADAVDPHPLAPAKVLRVKWDAVPGGTNGASWATALTNLQDALTLARNGLTTPMDPADDVAEIWVAAGVYKPTTTTNDRNANFQLVNNTALYGGFSGIETKLSQRVADPLFNGTVLSGDLLDNDASTYGENPGSFADNSLQVCGAGQNVGSGTIFDGFTITGGNKLGLANGGGMFSLGNPRLRNLLFRANHSAVGGAALAAQPVPDTEIVISDCLFLQNSGDVAGAVLFSAQGGGSNARLAMTNCQFILNEAGRAPSNIGQGGGLYVAGEVSLEGCTFRLNTGILGWGGGIYVANDSAMRISNCRFLENSANMGGGLYFDRNRNFVLEVVQSVFWKNSATGSAPYESGGAICISTNNSGGYTNKTVALYVLNSSFYTNSSPRSGGAIMVANNSATTRIENSILWGSTPNDLNIGNWQSQSRVRTSCLPSASQYPGAGNLNADPKFVNPAAGDLRLGSGSPCIDAGNNFIDYYPTVPGFQLLPDTDIDGFPFWRIVDGNGDGTPTVDMGAHERQGP